MCAGIALYWRDLPQNLLEHYRLQTRIVRRTPEAEPEVRFMYRDTRPLLPAWFGNQLGVYTWGNQNPKSRLPKTGWVRWEVIEAGLWSRLHPEEVQIPASLGLERGVWYQIREGVRGVLVYDEQRAPHIYMLTQPADHYYRVMTRHSRMPMLLEAVSQPEFVK